MFKVCKGSYDGRGNFKVDSEDDFVEVIKVLGILFFYVEKWVFFVKEFVVMVIRIEDSDGKFKNCVVYLVVEIIYEDSICIKVFMFLRDVFEDICEKVRKFVIEVISILWGRGVFVVEMFFFEDGKLLYYQF